MCRVADCAVREEVVLSPAELADFRRLFFLRQSASSAGKKYIFAA